jgi:Na+-translocating ferredoxin:NAD+ oxidoreductase RnfA subunit
MDLLLDLLQGVGLAAAIGVRPFLPVLLAGALAAADLGLDFDGTDFAFLEEWPFLLGVLVLVVALDFAGRRAGRDAADRPPLLYALLGLALVLGALLAAGSVADRSSEWWVGAIAGVAAAALGFQAARLLFGRVRRRLDDQTAGALPVYAEGVAVAAAGLSILFPPLALLVVGGLAWLLAGGRRREGEKYAGLRILR